MAIQNRMDRCVNSQSQLAKTAKQGEPLEIVKDPTSGMSADASLHWRVGAKVTGNAVRSQSGLKHARDTLVLM